MGADDGGVQIASVDEIYRKMFKGLTLSPDDLRVPDNFVQAARRFAEEESSSLSEIHEAFGDDVFGLPEPSSIEDQRLVAKALRLLHDAIEDDEEDELLRRPL